ncbi:MAG: hypothetical protein EOP68_16880, partial [Sphingomonas sp.]
MPRRLSVTVERFQLATAFTISRGSKTEAVVVVATLSDGDKRGRGECVPYARYGETVESVTAAIEAVRPLIEKGLSRKALQASMPAGAARNAVDCALWDLEAKLDGTTVASLVCPSPPTALETAYTISLGTPEVMAAATAAARGRVHGADAGDVAVGCAELDLQESAAPGCGGRGGHRLGGSERNRIGGLQRFRRRRADQRRDG